jgi:hypothetical protein
MYLHIESTLIKDVLNSLLLDKTENEKKELQDLDKNFNENYIKLKKINININKDVGKIAPLYDGNLNNIANKLIKIINNDNSKDRIDHYNNLIKNKQIWEKHFKEFSPNLPSDLIEKFSPVDSFIVVKNFRSDKSGIKFYINSLGYNSVQEPQEQET